MICFYLKNLNWYKIESKKTKSYELKIKFKNEVT